MPRPAGATSTAHCQRSWALLLVALRALPLRASSGAVAVGDTLILLPCGGADPQRQIFHIYGAGGALPFHIKTAAPNLVLDISGPSNASGTLLHVWGSYSPPVTNQEFDFSASDGLIRSRYNGMCVAPTPSGAPGLAPTFGSSIAIFACNASDASQRFIYDSASLAIASVASPSLCVQAVNATPTCDDAPFNTLPYCNSSLSLEVRVADLVSRMTPQEKVGALDSGVPAIARLGVPTMHSGEALHGPATGCLATPAPGSTGCPTSFPCPTALGTAYDESLWLSVGLAIGTEARALSNLNAGAVWLFAPNINLARDPRWGRNQEVPGEDATLVSAYGSAFVRGVQGEGGADPRHLLAATTLKHYIAYDVSRPLRGRHNEDRQTLTLSHHPFFSSRATYPAPIRFRALPRRPATHLRAVSAGTSTPS